MKTIFSNFRLIRDTKKKHYSFVLTKQQAYTVSLIAQLFLEEMIEQFNKTQLLKLVDEALDAKDRDRFTAACELISQNGGVMQPW